MSYNFTVTPKVVYEKSDFQTLLRSYDVVSLILPKKCNINHVIRDLDLKDHTKLISDIFNNSDGCTSQLRIVYKNKSVHLLITVLQDAKNVDADELRSTVYSIGVKIADYCKSNKCSNVAVFSEYLNNTFTKIDNTDISDTIVTGIGIASYKFSKYITDKKKKISYLSKIATSLDVKRISVINAKIESIFATKDLANEPPNILFPKSYADIVSSMFNKSNVSVSILDKKILESLGMNMLLAVGMGSDKPSYVVVMEYHGRPGKDYDLALVGKGLTFDSGGLSLKPSLGMEDMKYDMAGSASIVGTMKLLSSRKAKVNVCGIIGLVENSINGLAQRPSDIVTSMSGQTVEILNTDAEGRLVLGDILYYTATKYKPKHIIDLATLTGAIGVALGTFYGGLFSNNDVLSRNLISASQKSGELLWRLPLCKRFDKMMDSEIADMRNVTNTGHAGSSTAGQFLQRFIDDNKSWAHLDIANVAYIQKSPIGATAFGVQLLNTFVADHIEKTKN